MRGLLMKYVEQPDTFGVDRMLKFTVTPVKKIQY